MSNKDYVPSPLKRKSEVESEEENGANQPRKKVQKYIRHDTHWQPDGNVLLQFCKTRFKLQKSSLANLSPWFRLLFDAAAGTLNDDDFKDKEEIDEVILTSQVVDGLDLFYIDFEPINAESFARFLDCMDNAISYLTEQPDYREIDGMLNAVYFFRIQSYSTPLASYAKKLFPDEPEKVKATPTPGAIAALNRGRSYGSYDNLHSIVRCAFYQLARSPPEDLRGLNVNDLQLLVKVQRKLALTWDAIVRIVEPLCNDAKCINNRTPNTAAALRTKYLFDPVFGIQKLIKQDWAAKGFCLPEEKAVVAKLRTEESKIWADLAVWIKIEDGDSD